MSSASAPRILIVDDEPANVRLLVEALIDQGFELMTALNGKDALLSVQEGHPDLILLDILMPGMDGFEVCRRIKDIPETAATPVIFVTAKSEMEDETKGFELGAEDYITKPISSPVVRARIKRHLETKAQRDSLRDLSNIDGLTAIANRRRFDETLQGEWQRALRHAKPLALLMIDIDYFKRFNDTYGHVAGDECLRRVAKALSEASLRANDLVARYGGEEFAVILPECTVEATSRIAEGFRERVAATRVPLPGLNDAPSVTLSIGAGVVTPHPGLTPEQFVKKVDALLYRAKEEGRNRVVSRDFDGPVGEE